MIEAPAELRERAQWVAWKYVQREGEPKPTKVPINARTGRNASTTDPSTWSTYLEANAYADLTGAADGIGYVLSETDPYSGVDLDHCRDPETGTVETWAKVVIRKLASYTEISPSLTGMRIFVRGELPPHGRHKGSIEVYSKARFLTITGMRYGAAPSSINLRQDELTAWHHEVFGEPKSASTNGHRAPGTPGSAADIDILMVAQRANNGGKFMALWNGDWSGYGSQSEADLALVNLLAFYLGPDPARIDVLFRLSGLWRDKWEREDYRTWTISKALEGRTDYYDPHYRSGPSAQWDLSGSHTAAEATTDEARTELAHEIMTSTPAEIRQLCEHFLWEARTHWFYSGPGAGKTLLDLAILMHIAAGRPFHDHAVVQGTVLILEEDSSRSVIGEYLNMLADIYDIDMASVPLHFFKERGLTLRDRQGYDYVRSTIDGLPERPLVFLVDACERVVPSEKFNSKELEWVTKLFAENLQLGIANIMIDHTRKPSTGKQDKPDPIETLYGARAKSAISDIMMHLSGQVKQRATLTFPKFRGVEPGPVHVSFDGAEGFTVKAQREQLSETERMVQMVVNNTMGRLLTRAEIAQETGLRDRTLLRVLAKLVATGGVERLGETSATTYRVGPMSQGLFS